MKQYDKMIQSNIENNTFVGHKYNEIYISYKKK